jgi:Zn-dependent protease
MTLLDTLQFLVTFYMIGLVGVLAHEYGHALAAVRFGGAVNSLNVRFGPILFSRLIKIGRLKTNLCFRLFFVGGYVDIDKDSLVKFSRLQCVVVYLSGVLMNLLLAILAFALICISPKIITPPQYVVSVAPGAYTDGRTLLPANTAIVLSSLKETAGKTEWTLEPLASTGKSTEQKSYVMSIDEACSPDCEGMLQRLLGIELSKAFHRKDISRAIEEKLVVLTLNERHFGSIEAFQRYLSEVARVNMKLSIRAICGNQFCSYEDNASALLAHQWQPVSVRDQSVVSATMPLVTLPWVLTLEVLRETREGSRIALSVIGVLNEESRQYEGAFTRLAELYKAKGVFFSGWVIWVLAINVGMLVFNLIPFYGSDGCRVLQTLLMGKSKWRVISHQVFLAVSIGLVIFFLLGLMGKYITIWELLASVSG